MKRLAWPLYGQFLAWLALNLVLLGALAFVFTGRHGVGLEMLLTPQSRERAQGLGDALSRELAAASSADRPAVVARFGQAHDLAARLEPARPPGRVPRADQRPQDAPPPFEGPGAAPRRPPPDGGLVRIERRSSRFLLRIPLAQHAMDEQREDLVLETERLVLLLRFLGLTGWLAYLGTALVGSALLWWPFVRSITRRIGHLTRVTGEIARGSLDRRTDPGRPDELGRLGASINTMTARLQSQVEGQREFLMDVSHELASPLARVQVGLALAQQQAPPDLARALGEVENDALHMSALLQDLLQFSRSASAARTPRLTTVPLRRLLETACLQEGAVGRVGLAVPDGLAALADPELLLRAVANLVRNALRYGGDARIELDARTSAEGVCVSVADRGPGVAPDALPRLGEAFYRPDAARSSHTGGFGLGLAIARRCAQGCGGRLELANREGGGFLATLVLSPATGAV